MNYFIYIYIILITCFGGITSHALEISCANSSVCYILAQDLQKEGKEFASKKCFEKEQSNKKYEIPSTCIIPLQDSALIQYLHKNKCGVSLLKIYAPDEDEFHSYEKAETAIYLKKRQKASLVDFLLTSTCLPKENYILFQKEDKYTIRIDNNISVIPSKFKHCNCTQSSIHIFTA